MGQHKTTVSVETPADTRLRAEVERREFHSKRRGISVRKRLSNCARPSDAIAFDARTSGNRGSSEAERRRGLETMPLSRRRRSGGGTYRHRVRPEENGMNTRKRGRNTSDSVDFRPCIRSYGRSDGIGVPSERCRFRRPNARNTRGIRPPSGSGLMPIDNFLYLLFVWFVCIIWTRRFRCDDGVSVYDTVFRRLRAVYGPFSTRN